MNCEKEYLKCPDPLTGRSYGWTVEIEDGRRIPWRGFYTGPLRLTAVEINEICRTLLGCETAQIGDQVDEVLQPAIGARTAKWPALILHSTTPELKSFEGDVHALATGKAPGDLTTYKETRSVYFCRPGDVAVGRTSTWKKAVMATGTEAVELPDRDHYYLSHALLCLAAEHQIRPSVAIEKLLMHMRRGPRLIRLYALELEMQIFLLWLARSAGIEKLPVEANRPSISAAWNRKAVLHPTITEALSLKGPVPGQSPAQLLKLESSRSALARTMGIEVPTVPGYTIERTGRDMEGFVRQFLSAASLLRKRYNLTTGCLKASEAGDGARITTGLDLASQSTLERLARQGYPYGDDYVLEAHVHYRRLSLGGQELVTALSAHIRRGRVVEGATIQFMEGTSWKGNVCLDEGTHALFQVPSLHYSRLQSFIKDFREAFRKKEPGLALAGIDFSVGAVGGAFGDEVLLGVEDLNVSFTGAECLREFLEKARHGSDCCERRRYGLVRVYRPQPGSDLGSFRQVTQAATREGLYADTIASIPGRWGMVGITGADPLDAIENLHRLQRTLLEQRLIDEP